VRLPPLSFCGGQSLIVLIKDYAAILFNKQSARLCVGVHRLDINWTLKSYNYFYLNPLA
jgi:hypothetical protein